MSQALKTEDFKKNINEKLTNFKQNYEKKFGTDLVIMKGVDKKAAYHAQAIFFRLNSFDKSLYTYVFFENLGIRVKFVKDG